MREFAEIKISDWQDKYSSRINASNNKDNSVNRWFPILEGFSHDFVESIIAEQSEYPTVCLDPFAGGGTTPLTAQLKGIKCYSFEISPFMSQVCRAKLRNDYRLNEIEKIIEHIEFFLNRDITHEFRIGLKTISKNNSLKKWLFHKTALDSLLCIRKAIDISCEKYPKYKDLFYVTLGSIVLQFSNVYRDGKALRYRNNWEKRVHKRKDIYFAYLEKCKNIVFEDIKKLLNSQKQVESNLNYFHSGDCRKLIHNIDDELVDLVITSPPYLNSRDYTDSHMIELWLLGHISNYDELKILRGNTLRSHVQVNWGTYTLPNSLLLEKTVEKIFGYKEQFWNKNIPNMIAGYFCDLEQLLSSIMRKLKKNGKVYINVANSSYFGVVIETDRIIEEMAFNLGYKITDIRLARKIKTSSQQYGEVKWLRESVVVLSKS
jgi:Adenine-specific DNA methylase containing a Zn-ribbon